MPDDARVSDQEQSAEPQTPAQVGPDAGEQPSVPGLPSQYAPSAPAYPPPAPGDQAYPPPAPPAYPPAYAPQPPGRPYDTYGPYGYQQAPPGYGPSGYPPPGYPPQGYPPQGYPPTGYPPPGYQQPTRRPGPVDALGRPMAEWWRRVLAYVIDGLVLGIPWSIILSVTNSSVTTGSTTFTTANFTSSTWVGIGIGFIVVLGYFAFLDGSPRGQTLGKLVLGISVRDIRTGGAIGAGRALGKRVFFFATYFVFVVPFFLNALWPLWDARRQAWHDKVVGSCVVRVH